MAETIANVHRLFSELKDSSDVECSHKLAQALHNFSALLARDESARISLGKTLAWSQIYDMWSFMEAIMCSDLALATVPPWCISLARFTRNLVAGVTNNQNQAFELEPCLRRLVYHLTSFHSMQEEGNANYTRVFPQLLSNLITGNPNLQDKLWLTYMKLPTEQNVLTRLLASPDVITVSSTMVLILNCTKQSHERTMSLVETIPGSSVCRVLLDHLELTFEADPLTPEGRSFTISYEIFCNVFGLGAAPILWKTLESSEEPLTPHQTILLKLLDSYLQNPYSDIHRRDSIAGLLSSVASQVIDFVVKSLAPYVPSEGPTGDSESSLNSLDPRVPFVGEGILLSVQGITTLILSEEEKGTVSPTMQIVKKQRFTDDRPFIQGLVEILRILDSFLPRIIQGKPRFTTPNTTASNMDSQPTGFKNLKRDLVRLLGILCHKDREIQDNIRSYGGIPVIMNLCVVDERNPFLREHALFALSNLLQNNLENQGIVDAMKPSGEWDSEGNLRERPGAVRK